MLPRTSKIKKKNIQRPRAIGDDQNDVSLADETEAFSNLGIGQLPARIWFGSAASDATASLQKWQHVHRQKCVALAHAAAQSFGPPPQTKRSQAPQRHDGQTQSIKQHRCSWELPSSVPPTKSALSRFRAESNVSAASSGSESDSCRSCTGSGSTTLAAFTAAVDPLGAKRDSSVDPSSTFETGLSTPTAAACSASTFGTGSSTPAASVCSAWSSCGRDSSARFSAAHAVKIVKASTRKSSKATLEPLTAESEKRPGGFLMITRILAKPVSSSCQK
mmetsp:Transcript_27011/g.71055  ORF Transcript_27011/g.71055 Transcript_27011/m.71055 type:complete len:276 (-) Transcript_27011:553-1380(-)